jgi:iron complex outermembrane receptor protein
VEGLLKKEMGKISFSSFSHFKTAFNFINLEPTGNYSLSVRGAFPVFHYTASNVVSWVQDFSVSKSDFFIPNLNAQIKSSIVRLKEWGSSSNLLGVPPLSVQAQLSYQTEWRGIVFKPMLKANYTSFPFWAPKNLEIGRLPEGYLLVDLGTNFFWKDWSGSFQVNNALNHNYFNYLDRLRYFAMAPGRNFSITLKKTIQ